MWLPLIASHLDQSFMIDQWLKQQGVAVRSYLLHSSVAGDKLPMWHFTSLHKKCKNVESKPFFFLLSQIGMFWPFFIQFSSPGSHIEHLWSSSYTRGGTLFLLLNGKPTMGWGGETNSLITNKKMGTKKSPWSFFFELSPQRVLYRNKIFHYFQYVQH